MGRELVVMGGSGGGTGRGSVALVSRRLNLMQKPLIVVVFRDSHTFLIFLPGRGDLILFLSVGIVTHC